MRMRDRIRKWLVAFLRDGELHGKVNHIGSTMQGVLANVEEMHTVLPVLQRSLSALVEAEAERFDSTTERVKPLLGLANRQQDDMLSALTSLNAIAELQERVHLLLAPHADRLKARPAFVPSWEQVLQENLNQFEESANDNRSRRS